ncbi:MAG: hypothetical protein HXY40_12480 [Chloroflexi bacterium]|nr:hypothetical protein [Chloroflexota bacterium]
MSAKTPFGAAAFATLLALLAIVGSILASSGLPAGVFLQPYGLPAENFVRGINEHNAATLFFFASDTLFPLSYLLVFVGLYAATAERGGLYARVALGAGVLTALLDVTENALFISLALLAYNGVPAAEPPLLLVYALTTLKWTAAFATFYAFALVFPRGTWFEWLIAALMLAFPLFGALSVAQPALIVWRGLFMLGGMILLGVYFVLRYRAAE